MSSVVNFLYVNQALLAVVALVGGVVAAILTDELATNKALEETDPDAPGGYYGDPTKIA